jgi:uncharacterized protein
VVPCPYFYVRLIELRLGCTTTAVYMGCMPKPVDRHTPATWVTYNPQHCQNCWADCCTLPVQATSEEMFHLGFLKLTEVNGPLKRIAQRLKRDGIIAAYNDRTRLFRLAQRPGGDCVFLDSKRRCTVYDSRPSICRQFPMNSKRPGFCPHRPLPQP